MRCHICDRVLTEPNYDRDHDEYDPCETCLTVIKDTLASWTDKPYADEDDLGEEMGLVDLEDWGLMSI